MNFYPFWLCYHVSLPPLASFAFAIRIPLPATLAYLEDACLSWVLSACYHTHQPGSWVSVASEAGQTSSLPLREFCIRRTKVEMQPNLLSQDPPAVCVGMDFSEGL